MAFLNRVVVTKVKHLIGVIVVGFILFGLITWQNYTLNESSRRSDFNDLALSTYQVELSSFQIAAAQYEACLFRLEMREVYRRRFLVSAENRRTFFELFTNDVTAEPYSTALAIVAQEIADIEMDLPSLPRSTCPLSAPTAPILSTSE